MFDFRVVSGRASKILSQKVADKLEMELSPVSIKNFSDGEIWAKYEENIRGEDLFIIQATNAPADNLLELLILIDAAKRASARRVTAVIPYFGYARQDRKDQPRVSITAKLVANLLTRSGADRVISIDLHSAQIQGYFDIPFDHLYASPVILKRLLELDLSNTSVCSPDVGGVKTARSYAKKLSTELVLAHKIRDDNKVEIMKVIGNVAGRNIIIVDDIVDTASSFVECARSLKEAGANRIIGACVHPVLSNKAMEKIENSGIIDKLIITDTIPLKQSSPILEEVSISELLAEAIVRTHNNSSISCLFEIIR